MMMKPIFTFIIAQCFVFSCFAQQGRVFKLKGKTNSTGKLYLNYVTAEGKSMRDSTVIKDGTFAFTGQISEPTLASFYGTLKSRSVEDPNTTNIFLEAGDLVVTVAENHFKELVMKGSESQREMEALAQLKAPVIKEMEGISEALRKEKNHEKASEIRDQLDPFNARMDKIDYEFFASHPHSYVTAYMMRYHIGELTAKEASDIYNKWSARIKQSSYGKEIAEEIKKLESGSPGNIALSFNVKDINGDMLNLSDFKGKKYVMLDFWASWCVPCRKGNPHLISKYNSYKDKGFEVIGIASDDNNPNAWRKAVEQDQIGIWRHVLSGLKRTATGYDKSAALGEGYGIHSLPTKILIDKNGVIIGRYGGGGESDGAMDKKLSELFDK